MVAKDVKVVQSGQGADEVFAGYHWYPRLAEVAREDEPERYAETYFDRPHADLARILEPHMLPDDDPSGRFVREHMAVPGAETVFCTFVSVPPIGAMRSWYWIGAEGQTRD